MTLAALETAIPSREIIDQSVSNLRHQVAPDGPAKHGAELEMLRKALKAEAETSSFYKEMVRTLDAEGQKLFERFVEIEEGHLAIVQAQIDSVSGTGYWFDTPDFRM
jgi:rubrerythrin